jgi:hypothetical protein
MDLISGRMGDDIGLIKEGECGISRNEFGGDGCCEDEERECRFNALKRPKERRSLYSDEPLPAVEGRLLLPLGAVGSGKDSAISSAWIWAGELAKEAVSGKHTISDDSKSVLSVRGFGDDPTIPRNLLMSALIEVIDGRDSGRLVQHCIMRAQRSSVRPREITGWPGRGGSWNLESAIATVTSRAISLYGCSSVISSRHSIPKLQTSVHLEVDVFGRPINAGSMSSGALHRALLNPEVELIP